MKYPRTRQGMARRRNACDVQTSKHSAARQFNPHNGELHTKKWLDQQRAAGLRRKR